MSFDFKELEEFQKEFKKLSSKFNSLKDDFQVLKDVLEIDPTGKSIMAWKVERISGLWDEVDWEFYKIRRFRCKSHSKNSSDSWIRIIYRYEESSAEIEFKFIEIFQKSKKPNHDIKRIKKNF